MILGILTYHRSHNYGALLQAVALRVYLQQNGHEVYYIDYWPKYHRQMYKVFDIYTFRKRGIKGKFGYLYSIMSSYSQRVKRINAFHSFIQSYIEPYCKPFHDNSIKYDAIIYGSDQIWRRQERLGGDFNTVYFADNELFADKHISYAASMGEIIINDTDKERLSKLLQKFNYIGVREKSLQDLLFEIGFKNTKLNVDPTMLLSMTQWERTVPIRRITEGKYALLYDLHPESFDKEKLLDYCKSHSLELIILEGSAKRSERNTYSIGGPEIMMSLIAYADVVFTSSFHGLVFSILFHKELFASFKTNSDRAKTLMKATGIDRRLVSINDCYNDDYKIDYDEVDKRLSEMTKDSMNFMDFSLKA